MTAFDFGDSDPLDAYDEGDAPELKKEILKRVLEAHPTGEHYFWAQDKLNEVRNG